MSTIEEFSVDGLHPYTEDIAYYMRRKAPRIGKWDPAREPTEDLHDPYLMVFVEAP